ncbi:hypothetical protein RFI_36792, partial [Reticulomyxa filosa]
VIPALVESTTGNIAKTDKEKVEIYSEDTKEHYQLVEDEITSVIEMNRDEEMNCYPLWDEYHQMDITKEEIEALRYISSHKAQGPDNIHNQMIKNGGQALIDSLVVLFNWSFKIGYVPRLWKRANIVPITKPDRDHSICKTYRPISLLSG